MGLRDGVLIKLNKSNINHQSRFKAATDLIQNQVSSLLECVFFLRLFNENSQDFFETQFSCFFEPKTF